MGVPKSKWGILEWRSKLISSRSIPKKGQSCAISLVTHSLIMNLTCSVFWRGLGGLNLKLTQATIPSLNSTSFTLSKRGRWSSCKLICANERSQGKVLPFLLGSLDVSKSWAPESFSSKTGLTVKNLVIYFQARPLSFPVWAALSFLNQVQSFK